MSQISESQVRAWARDELRKIIDCGLMYSAGCVEATKINVTSPSPVAPTTPPQTDKNVIRSNPALYEPSTPQPQPKWEPMQPTEKGPWEKTIDTNNPEIKMIITEIMKEHKAFNWDGYKYWVLEKNGEMQGVGRRKL